MRHQWTTKHPAKSGHVCADPTSCMGPESCLRFSKEWIRHDCHAMKMGDSLRPSVDAACGPQSVH
eukprot:6338013-Pyramimonas_sp.AAC.1